MKFINMLNETSVTFLPDLGRYWGPEITGPGYEAISYYGEIAAFRTWQEANAFRMPVAAWE